MIPPFPLAWPDGMPRTPRPSKGPFRTTLGAAVKNVQESLRLFGSDTGKKVADVAVTSNVAGLGSSLPADKAVAVWFTWEDEQRCIAVDRYDSLEANVQAIHHVIEAHRALMRHGGLNVVRQTFKGFTALPAPTRWQDVLGFPPGAVITRNDVLRAYREKAEKAHPDKPGGSNAAMAELNEARDRALRELPD